MDDLRRARAILGVSQGLTPEQLRTRYRELVKQWHPDRYASDPQGQIEAEARMREINVAFDLLLAAGTAPPVSSSEAPAAAPSRAPVPGQRLTREQIDRLVGSIGTDGPLDWLLEKRSAPAPPSVRQLLVRRLGFSLWFGFFTSILVAGPPGAHPIRQLLLGLAIAAVAFVGLRPFFERPTKR